MAYPQPKRGVYYNEFDPFAASWLRELIKQGLIPDGVVDERSIVDVRPADLIGFRACHFFAGIAGWPLALRLAGWPDEREMWTGSCPCPIVSNAGKKARCPVCEGKSYVWCPRRTGFAICADCGHEWFADERHLWPEFWRLIAERRPAAIFGEQSASRDGLDWFVGVRGSLEIIRYAVGAANLPACAVGAPHRRERLFWVADADGKTRRRQARLAEHGDSVRADSARSEQFGRRNRERLADAAGSRWEQGCAAGATLEHRQKLAAGSGRGVPLADPESIGWRGRPDSEDGGGRQCAPADSRAGSGERLGDASGARLSPSECKELRGKRRQDEGRTASESSSARFWDSAEWRLGADGKTRRVGPGIRLLAHGISGRVAVRRPGFEASAEVQEHWYSRVGALRGLGNAVVSQVAAEFVRAFMEVSQ